MKKDDIRRHIRARKALLNAEERLAAAERVFETVQKMAAFTLARRILLYHSLPDELSTREFIDRWHERKEFFLPRVNGLNLEILPYDRSKLHLGAFQIEEPDGTETVDLKDIDLVIVPAVAYDRQGNRVGRGKGYYDRLLSTARALTKIGVGYGFQLVDEIEADPFDVAVDFVVTDGNGVIRCRRR
ncbi:MAG: 5-formyltetrahydrofolate cyclo-ligase [Muribaculaceae bacterium]|nr:5-formyltetrahydrofolate cyclo-ligase [Muribaculaceae bacterium]